jgi:hypothetical protein
MFNSGNLTPADLQKKSFAGAIARYQPNGTAKLVALSSMLKRETAINTTHGYFSRSMVFPFVTVNGSRVAGDTTLVVDDTSIAANGSPMIPGMILRTALYELVLVTAVASSTSMTIVRAFGSVAAQGIADNEILYMVGTAYEEASARPLPYSLDTIQVSNYTQIFRNSWAVSGSASAVQVIAGNKADAENKADCMAMHARDVEFMSLFGQQKTGVNVNGKPIRASEGLEGNIMRLASGNVTNVVGATSYTSLETMLDKCFNTNIEGNAMNERILFVGGVARRVINNIGRLNSNGSGWTTTSGETEFGMQFDSFKIARGTFHMIEHPLLNAYGAGAPQAFTAIAVHLPTFNYAYLGGRDTKAEDYGLGGSVLQAGVTDQSGVDAMGGSLTSELCTQIKLPAANAIIRNLNAAAVG